MPSVTSESKFCRVPRHVAALLLPTYRFFSFDNCIGAPQQRHRSRGRHISTRKNFPGTTEAETRWDLVDAKLMSMRLSRRRVTGDGACQFRALAVAMYGSEVRHVEIRKNVVDHMEENRQTYGGFSEGPWCSYVGEMRTPNTWGDNITLQAAADLYKLRVHLVSSHETEIQPIAGGEGLGDAVLKDVLLAYMAEHHYDAVGTAEISATSGKS